MAPFIISFVPGVYIGLTIFILENDPSPDVDQIKLILFVPDPAKVNVSPSQILTSNPALAVGPGAIVKSYHQKHLHMGYYLKL